jgi:glycosyltransferase involved in cell wall biosynthesis
VTELFSGYKVLLVGPIPPPAGGMANQTQQLKQLLQNSGAKVELLAVNAPYKPKWIENVPGLRSIFRLVPYCWRLLWACRRNDVVHLMANSGWSWHLFATPAIWIAWLSNTPLLVNYRGGYAETFFKKSWRIVALSLNRTKGIIVPSSFLQEVFGKWGRSAKVVPNVLNEKIFYPESGDKNNGQLHIIVTRNLEAIYDVSSAIRCFKLIKDKYQHARFSVAGTGPEKNMLVELCDELGISGSVEFLGRLDIAQMANLYRCANVMLNTSTVDNSPNSVIEALACGVPVVTTNVGGIPKLVKHEYDALLVEPGQPEKLFEQMTRILEDDELSARLVANGLMTVEKFMWKNVSLHLLENYQHALINKGEKA